MNFESLIALLTLTSLEVVLGIDNVIFISILVSKLPKEQQKKARFIGLLLAMFMRILLLLSISWVMGLTQPLFTAMHHEVSGRDLILLIGGLFLLAKSTHEIHEKLEGEKHQAQGGKKAALGTILVQIILLDIVFSLDSVITAVGMSDQILIMVASVMIAVGFMMVFAGSVSDFVEKHPTVKMLALSFLLLIGVMLLADGMGQHISKGYVYFAMAFSVFVEMLNLRIRPHTHDPVQLRQPPL
jgi:predicted tellurium resistance membrane protein TerC